VREDLRALAVRAHEVAHVLDDPKTGA
jgi:hypothetical protein